jgi:quinol monooxygenase YgiN
MHVSCTVGERESRDVVDSAPQLIEPQDKQTVFINVTRISVKPERRKEFHQTIFPLLDSIRREKGCLTCNFYSDVRNDCESLLLGEWESETALNEHLKSPHFALLSAALSVLAKQETMESRVLTDSELLTD